MRTIKVLAVLGLAVALVVVPALAQGQQQPQPKVVEVKVTCDTQENKIKVSINPVRLNLAAKETVRWVFSGQRGDSVGECKVEGGQLNPRGTTLKDSGLTKIEIALDVRDLLKFDNNPIGWEDKKDSTINGTPLKAGTSKYSIKFLDKEGKTLLEVKEASVLVIEVTPTLTEWGLIALAVLLMGGMGYMLYRRRPALRPAAP